MLGHTARAGGARRGLSLLLGEALHLLGDPAHGGAALFLLGQHGHHGLGEQVRVLAVAHHLLKKCRGSLGFRMAQ